MLDPPGTTLPVYVSFRISQTSTDTVSQARVATARTSQGLSLATNLHTTNAKARSPILPIAAPAASMLAASLPRVAPSNPSFSFFSFSYFSIRVALAGKIAGKARNSPPIAGPNLFAIIPATAVLRGHLKSGHAWSVQNRPCTKAVRDEIVLLCRLLRKQVCFCAPASRTALEYVSVVKQAVEHGSDGRTVSQQLAPVFHGAVGGQ
jgi:hypothetical protein